MWTIGLRNLIRPVSRRRLGNWENKTTRKKSQLTNKLTTNKPPAHIWKIIRPSVTPKRVFPKRTTLSTTPPKLRNPQTQNFHMILILCPRRTKDEKNSPVSKSSVKAPKYLFKPRQLKICLRSPVSRSHFKFPVPSCRFREKRPVGPIPNGYWLIRSKFRTLRLAKSWVRGGSERLIWHFISLLEESLPLRWSRKKW